MKTVSSLHYFNLFNNNAPNIRIIAYYFSVIKIKKFIKGFDPVVTIAGLKLLTFQKKK